MKTVENLLNARGNKKLGNHRKEVGEGFERYIYYGTCVCKVDHNDKTIIINDGGWGTSSTTRTINAYLRSHDIQRLIVHSEYNLIDAR